MALATISLPTPLSPRMRIVAVVSATCSILRSSARMSGLAAKSGLYRVSNIPPYDSRNTPAHRALGGVGRQALDLLRLHFAQRSRGEAEHLDAVLLASVR